MGLYELYRQAGFSYATSANHYQLILSQELHNNVSETRYRFCESPGRTLEAMVMSRSHTGMEGTAQAQSSGAGSKRESLGWNGCSRSRGDHLMRTNKPGASNRPVS